MFERVKNHETAEKLDEEMEGAEQIAIDEEIINEAEALYSDAIDNETASDEVVSEDCDEEPSADDFQAIED